MRSIQVLFLLATASLAQSTMAQGVIGGNRFDALQAQIDALAAPNSSVEGRVYCRTVSTTVLLGDPAIQTEGLIERSTRQIVTFGPEGVADSVVLDGLSAIQARQLDNGVVSVFALPIGTGFATYTQTGTELIMTFTTSGNVRTFHVSRDGSVVFGGKRITPSTINPANAVIFESTFVEIDPATGAQCAADVL